MNESVTDGGEVDAFAKFQSWMSVAGLTISKTEFTPLEVELSEFNLSLNKKVTEEVRQFVGKYFI